MLFIRAAAAQRLPGKSNRVVLFSRARVLQRVLLILCHQASFF